MQRFVIVLVTLVALVSFAPSTLAQEAGVQTMRQRGWIDVNLGAAGAGQDTLSTAYNKGDGTGEMEIYRVSYSFPRGASFDFGGGVMFTPLFGAGVAFTGTAHEDAAGLSIRIPHPLYYDSFASDSKDTENKLLRTEGGVNLSVVVIPPIRSNRLVMKLFAGPTYFRLKADAVSNVRYEQVYGIFTRANAVEISDYDTVEVEETGWGLHAGADIGFFFSRYVGVGGFARFSHGTLTVEDSRVPVDDPVDVKLGGVQAGAGLRIRF
ncbi:MAG: hypothetical protein ACE148_15945 [Vicinamibacterales bacterium]